MTPLADIHIRCRSASSTPAASANMHKLWSKNTLFSVETLHGIVGSFMSYFYHNEQMQSSTSVICQSPSADM